MFVNTPIVAKNMLTKRRGETAHAIQKVLTRIENAGSAVIFRRK
jgi:hypothetical protein